MPNGSFIKSAVLPQDFPPGDKPEIVLAGRSNAGKSSFLNALCNSHSLAKVSRTPGKTRTINFFDVGSHYRIVDLPGYGFAQRPAEERRLWDQMIMTYFKERACIGGLLLIADVRREWSPHEEMICGMAHSYQIPVLGVLTKIDKLGRSELDKAIQARSKESGRGKNFFRPISSLKKTGMEDLEKEIFEAWIKKVNL